MSRHTCNHNGRTGDSLRGVFMIVLCALGVILSATAPAQVPNRYTTIPIHAVDASQIPCNQFEIDGINCEENWPNVDVWGFEAPAILIMLNNYDSLVSFQGAFGWPEPWVLVSSAFDCLPGTVPIRTPTASGPTEGTLTLAFDHIAGGMLTAIGKLYFAGPVDGCIRILESDYPYGCHVVSETGLHHLVRESNRGKVCAGEGGDGACWNVGSAVSQATWGGIRHQYR